MINPLKHGLRFSPKVIILITAIVFFGCLDVAGADQGFDINIEITGATTGRVMASVYQLEDDTETHFLTTKAVFKISGQPDAAGSSGLRFRICQMSNMPSPHLKTGMEMENSTQLCSACPLRNSGSPRTPKPRLDHPPLLKRHFYQRRRLNLPLI